MPIVNHSYSLSSAVSTLVVGSDNMPHDVTLHNQTKSSNHYVYVGGGSAVGTAGVEMDPGETLQITLQPNDELWAISDPDAVNLRVMDIRKAD